MTEVSTRVRVTIRYFAAARAAAGMEIETLLVEPGTTVDDVVGTLGKRNERLSVVLARCSYLRDGVAVRDRGESLKANETLDVLPPFAGG